jgi:transposase
LAVNDFLKWPPSGGRLVLCHLLAPAHCDYTDLGGDYFTRRHPDRQRDRLIKQLHDLGYRVTLDRVA